MARQKIEVCVHPPERRQRRGVVLHAACSCCCCCCCCLHVVGSLVGAVVASVRSERMPPRGPLPFDALKKFEPHNHSTEVSITGGHTEAGKVTTAPPLPPQPIPPWDIRITAAGKLSGAGLYWLTLFMVTPIACAVASIGFGSLSSGILVVLFILFPAVQLAASPVAALLVLLWPPEDRPPRWRAIVRIAAYTLFGTFVGLLALGAFCLMIR